MNLEEFINKINKLEKSIDISNLKAFDFNPWPSIRLNILFKYSKNSEFQAENPSGISLPTKIKTLFSCIKQYLANPVKKENIDILYFTRSSDLQTIGGKLFNKYSDPLISFFVKKYKIKVIETQDDFTSDKLNYFNKNTSNIFIKILLLRIKTAIKLRVKKSFINHDLKYEINQIFHFNIDLNKDILLINELSKYFEKILKLYQPRIVMLACFYRPDAMAMTLACKRLGIKVAEYQHGSQNNLHYMYTNWANIPQNGYELIPDIFWMWGRVSAERISWWADKTSRHKAIIGGNLWLAYKKTQVQNHLETSSDMAKFNILISLQGDERFAHYLIDYIEANGKGFSWYFRDHPRIPVSDKLREKLDTISDVSVKTSSCSDLYALLEKMNLHVTGYSTVAFEAQSFGVPTIFTHVNAKKGFSNLIGKNGLYFAGNIAEFHEKIFFIKENKEEIEPDYIISDIKIAEKALKKLTVVKDSK